MKKRISAVFCALTLVLWCMAGAFLFVSAEGKGGTLALWCVKDEEIVSGMHWKIYRVGHRENNDYIFESAFSGYRPTLGDRTKPMLEWDADTISAAAETLRVYAIIDKIPVRSDGYTNEQGNLQFTGLEDGLYLVIGDITKKGIKTYIPSAIFFEMNGQEEAYLNAFPKIILKTLDEQSAEYSVRKVWMNDTNQPPDTNAYILCELYRDGELKETVRLDASNGWLYQWSDKTGHEWLVREKEIPAQYSVVYKENHTQYLIVNTFDDTWDDSSRDENTTPASTTTTDSGALDRQTTVSTATQVTGEQTTAASNKSTTDQTGSTSGDSNHTTQTTTQTQTQTTTVPPPGNDTPQLPQTGQLWWPVPALAAGGTLFLVIGRMIGKRNDDE